QAENIWQLQGWDGNINNPPAMPYRPILKTSTETTYHTASDDFNIGVSSNGQILQTVTVDTEYDSYGNVLTQTSTTSGDGNVQTKQTVNQYGAAQYEKEKGRLERTTVTDTRVYGDGTPADIKSRTVG